MRAVVQRTSRASVRWEGGESAIGTGFLVLLGVERDDTEDDARWLARKCAGLRVFRDDDDRMNRSLLEVGGEMLVVSQFTLYGDCRKGKRPSFDRAAPPEKAEALYERFVEHARAEGVRVHTGSFGAMMDVTLTNDGPVTLILESRA
jgi:D-tyrosyl-tRNA(Tyr) deacylase